MANTKQPMTPIHQQSNPHWKSDEETVAGYTVEQWNDQLATMSDADKASLILYIVGEYTEFEQSRDFKRLAMELAETLGPDHCQTLYRLAVLATKLA